jgi:hypothetical protein
MSNLTDVILTCDSLDAWIATYVCAVLDECDVHLSQSQTAIPIALFTGVANYLDSDLLVDVINCTEWRDPGSVQLFLRGEDSQKLTSIELDPLALPGYAMVWDAEEEQYVNGYERNKRPTILGLLHGSETSVDKESIREAASLLYRDVKEETCVG